MAKGKGKKVSSGGPHKKHGPKKHMHSWTGPLKWKFGQMGALTKYSDKESFAQSLNAKGIKSSIDSLWNNFLSLPKEERRSWFKNLSKEK